MRRVIMRTNLTRKERKQIKKYNDCIRPIDKIMRRNNTWYVLFCDSYQYEEAEYMIDMICEELNLN